MDAREIRARLSVVLLMAVTGVGLVFFVDVDLVDRPGVRMSLPARAGNWTGTELRFCHDRECAESFTTDELDGASACPACGGPLHTMSWVEKEQLPADTEFVKGEYVNPAGDRLFVSVVLSGRERSSIHRPQRCLTAQGYQIMDSRVARLELPERNLDAMVLSLLYRQTGAGGTVTADSGHFAYWFVGRERETPYHLGRMFWMAWDRLVNGVAHKWAYVSIASWSTGASFTRELHDFAAAWYPLMTPPGQ